MVFNILFRFRSVRAHYMCCHNVMTRSSFTPAVRGNDQFHILKDKLLANVNGFSLDFVNTVRYDVLSAGNRINSQNFDSIFIEACIQNDSYEIGKLFFHHIFQKNKKTTLGLIGKYFRLCCHFKNLCSDSDKQFLISLYNKVIKEYSVLDAMSCESLSMGLSITDNWRESVKLLEMCKDYNGPSHQLYASIIKAAFCHKDDSLGWNMFEEMLKNSIKPHHSIYSSIITEASESSISHLFKLLEKYDLLLPEETVKSVTQSIGGKVTTITPRGYCKNCADQLAQIVINESEFEELTSDFLNPVLIGQDVFIKSKPTELYNFKEFLKTSHQVDIVLDGLNVAYSGSKKKYTPYSHSKMLMDVVNHFVSKNLRVMVLGRNHMRKWTPSHMNFIKKNAVMFFADDLSSDDPFVLYATMYNGLGTKFVSRDLMRGHKFLLKTPSKQKTFSKWQQKHQLFLTYVEKNGSVRFQDGSKYLVSPQYQNNKWHVPIIEPSQPGIQPHIQALNMRWLCLQFSNDQPLKL